VRALLFNPWITDFAAFDHWTRPLNLLRLAALLRQCGWQVDFYDCLDRRSPDLAGLPPPPRHRLNPFGCGHYYREPIPAPPVLEPIPRTYKRYGVPPDRVEAQLRTLPPPNVAMIPCMMTYWYPGAFDAIRMIRRIFPRAVVILGGTYAALCRNHAEIHSGADWVLTGAHWPEIVARIRQKVESSGDSCPGDAKTWIEPAYDLIRGETCLPLLTSVGCPCHCSYCATHALWPMYARYDRDVVMASIERMTADFGARDIAFFDDALLIHKDKHILPILEETMRRGIRARFHTPNALHVRQIDRETARLLKRSGFSTLRLGLETTQPDRQKATGGKVNTDEYQEAMRHLREAGFTAREVGTYILFGLPWQSIREVWDACRIVAAAGSEIKLAMYSPVPGTPLFDPDPDDFRFDPREEPLLQNNSLSPWRSRDVSYEAYQELKRFIAGTNRDLREKV